MCSCTSVPSFNVKKKAGDWTGCFPQIALLYTRKNKEFKFQRGIESVGYPKIALLYTRKNNKFKFQPPEKRLFLLHLSSPPPIAAICQHLWEIKSLGEVRGLWDVISCSFFTWMISNKWRWELQEVL